MKMAISKQFWKYALLAMSSIISIVVVVYLTCGVVALGGVGLEWGAYVVTIVGCLVMTLSFCGCFASLRESYILSIIYLGLTALTIISQMLLMIGLMLGKDDIMEMAEKRVQCMWEKEKVTPGTMNGLQVYYSCCGSDGPQDYISDDDDNDELPASCCFNGDCSVQENVFTKGCIGAIKLFVDNQIEIFIMCSLALTIAEVLGFVSAYYLSKRVKNIIEKPERIFVDEE